MAQMSPSASARTGRFGKPGGERRGYKDNDQSFRAYYTHAGAAEVLRKHERMLGPAPRDGW